MPCLALTNANSTLAPVTKPVSVPPTKLTPISLRSTTVSTPWSLPHLLMRQLESCGLHVSFFHQPLLCLLVLTAVLSTEASSALNKKLISTLNTARTAASIMLVPTAATTTTMLSTAESTPAR